MPSQTRPSLIYPTRDLRSAALRSKLGARGYGIYCPILEEMANQCAEYLRCDLKTLAWILRASEKMIESVIKDFDLFELTPDGEFFRHREAMERPKAENSPTERPLEPFETSGASNGSADSFPLPAEDRTKAPPAPRNASPATDPEIDLALSAAVEKCTSDQLIEVMNLVKEAREDFRRKRASARGDPQSRENEGRVAARGAESQNGS